jgi:hypothetical protein
MRDSPQYLLYLDKPTIFHNHNHSSFQRLIVPVTQYTSDIETHYDPCSKDGNLKKLDLSGKRWSGRVVESIRSVSRRVM